jgi:hypothetical protein
MIHSALACGAKTLAHGTKPVILHFRGGNNLVFGQLLNAWALHRDKGNYALAVYRQYDENCFANEVLNLVKLPILLVSLS